MSEVADERPCLESRNLFQHELRRFAGSETSGMEWNNWEVEEGGTGRVILPRSNVLTGMFCFDCYTTGYFYLPPGI